MFIDSARVISFVSGKGGVGKTLLVSELAMALSQKGRKVLIIDGDTGLANVEIFFGVRSKGHLGQVVTMDRSLDEVLTTLAPRVDVISSGSGIRSLNHLSALERQGLIASLLDLQYQYDYVLIDTASGLSEFTFQLAAQSDHIILTLTPDPSSFADAYAVMKLLNQDFRRDTFTVLSNMVDSEISGSHLFSKFTEVAGRFLILSLDYLGSVTYDEQVKKIVQAQKIPLRQMPQSLHAQQIHKVLDHLLIELKRSGHLSHFWSELSLNA